MENAEQKQTVGKSSPVDARPPILKSAMYLSVTGASLAIIYYIFYIILVCGCH